METLRSPEPPEWMFVSSQDMITDLGTQIVDDPNLVNKDSTWINRYDWMKKDQEYLPTKLIHQIRLENEDLSALKKENIRKYHNQDCNSETHMGQMNTYLVKEPNEYNKEVIRQTSHFPDEVAHCYSFFNYLLDHKWFAIVIRILEFVLKFIKNLKRKSKKLPIDDEYKSEIKNILLKDEEIETSQTYFFQKATIEVKKLVNKSHYQRMSIEKNGILYYSGRILPTDKIQAASEMTEVMKGLCSSTLCVPLVYKHLPLAYSIVNEIYWHSAAAKKSGIETVWRYVRKIAYIVFGRDLVKSIKVQCERCRHLMKKTTDFQMGPISKYNIIRAPAFYGTQVDICWPFKAC